MLGFLPTRAYRPGTPGATTFLSPLSGTFNYGWDSFLVAGVVVGGITGIIGGLVLYEVALSAFCDPADNSQFYTCRNPGAVGSAAIFGAIGAIVGGVIGSKIPSQSFSVRPYVGPSSGLGLTVRARTQ